jgi:outer membrane protein assembly factor BamB
MLIGRKTNQALIARYISKTETPEISVEIAFSGGAEKSGQENPRCTHVVARCLKKANLHSPKSPWIEIWAEEYGNPIMPSGAWNGIKLVEIFAGRVFLGISNRLMEVALDTGKSKWSLETGNTPIYNIMSSEKNEFLIVFNGYYGFKHKDILGNIVAINLEGKEVWRVHLPHDGDIFANAPYYDNGILKSSSWNCFTCSIDEGTGNITKKVFTK